MKSYLMNERNMAQSCRVGATAFDRWEVTPVERKGREAFYDVTSVIDNRVSNAINQTTDDKGEIDDDELLRIRIRLLTAQAEVQKPKNERERGGVIDIVFCIYVPSKLASQISSVMDNLPLVTTRKSPDMKSSMLGGLEKEIIRACNTCTKPDENIPLMLSDYLMETAGNVPDKLQPNKDK